MSSENTLQTLAARRRFVLNPVLRRELIERWRGRRAFVVVTAYLAVLMGIMLLLLWAGRTILSNDFGFGQQFTDPGPLLGRFLMENLVAFVLLLVLFIGPGYAAAQVSGERERKTLGLLQVTLVKPWSIVLGKLGAAVAWLLLLIVASLPLGAVAFFLGGITLADLTRALVYILGIALSVAAIGIGVSSVTRKTTASIVVTYGLVLMLVVGSLFATAIEAVVRRDQFRFGEQVQLVSLLFNPFYGLADAVRSQESFMLPSVLQPFALGLPEENRGQQVFPEPAGRGFDLGGDGSVGEQILDGQAAQDVFDEQQSREPVWWYVLGIHLVMGSGAMVIASQRVQAGRGPRRRRSGGGEERVVIAGGVPTGVGGGLGEPPPPPPPDARVDATLPPPDASYRPPPHDGGSG